MLLIHQIPASVGHVWLSFVTYCPYECGGSQSMARAWHTRGRRRNVPSHMKKTSMPFAQTTCSAEISDLQCVTAAIKMTI